MKEDRKRWNQKYDSGDFPRQPSKVVQQFSAQATLGRALDIAAGGGRNSYFLAERGFDVEALDISDRALREFPPHPNVRPMCVDLDDFDIPMNRYNLVINTRFLLRRLFPQILEGLTDGGMVIFETYLTWKEKEAKGLHRRDYMLRSNELLHAFLPLKIIYYKEGIPEDSDEERPIASLVAIKDHNWE